jgi:signal transduction histidine kinase
VKHEANSYLENWKSEIEQNLSDSNAFCLAVFNTKGELLLANQGMQNLFSGQPVQSFINPTLNQLIIHPENEPLVFDGLITLGSKIKETNTSIRAKVFRKHEQLLIVGEVDVAQLAHYNNLMVQLNAEVNKLQHELIKEKKTLEITLKQLHELNATKDKFFSIIAHDLKNPFLSIMGFSKILLEKYEQLEAGKTKAYLKAIDESANQAYELLENLLTWAQSQRGHIEFNPDFFELKHLIDKNIRFLKETAEKKKIGIKSLVNENQNVYADQNMLNTIIRNLLTNAIKFTYPDGLITINLISHTDYHEISVSDTGMGMGPETVSKLFKASTKTTVPGTQNERGTGLGLLICKEFVEQHGGTIRVESEVNKGSTFYITLPFSPN